MCIRQKTTNETRWLCASCAAGYVTVLLWIFWDRADWQGAAKPLNVIVVAMILGLCWIAIRKRKRLSARLILQIVFGIFALGLLTKIFFNIAIYHYGFALTGPAFALVVLLLVGWIPGMIHRMGGTAWVFRAAVMTVLGCFALRYLNAYETAFRSHAAVTIGSGADQFQVYRSGEEINRVLGFLSYLPAGDTVATVPQGAMINYLSRRVNPTGEVTLLPGEMEMFGERRILDRFTEHRPEWIVWVRTPVFEFGYEGFGFDYGMDVAGFIKGNYDNVPLGKGDGTMYLLKFDPGHQFRSNERFIDGLK